MVHSTHEIIDDRKRFKMEKSRRKERTRNVKSKEALTRLLDCIPCLNEQQKSTASKIQTIKLAIRYITHLRRILDGNWEVSDAVGPSRPLQYDDFRFIADEELKVRNSYRDRAQQELKNQNNKEELANNPTSSSSASSSASCSPMYAPMDVPMPIPQQPFIPTYQPNQLPNVYSLYECSSPNQW